MFKKTILAIAASGLLGLGALTMTPATASAADTAGIVLAAHNWNHGGRYYNRHYYRRYGHSYRRHHRGYRNCRRVWERFWTRFGPRRRLVSRCYSHRRHYW